MSYLKLAAGAALALLALDPGLAQARAHHHHHHHRHHHHHGGLYSLPYQISYLHNYGPGRLPETFSYYDGPSTVHCAQSAAAYLGQDHRRHPCN
jgi:hypothetical protein